jgi:hypothetical protein
MTKLLEEAISRLRALPEGDQDMAARFLLGFADPETRYVQIDDDQAAEVELARREIREGKIATDAEMAEVWRRFDA